MVTIQHDGHVPNFRGAEVTIDDVSKYSSKRVARKQSAGD